LFYVRPLRFRLLGFLVDTLDGRAPYVPPDLTQILPSAHRAYLRGLYGAQEKKTRLFPCTVLMNGFYNRLLSVFTARYGLGL
jgi:hypothetical protein